MGRPDISRYMNAILAPDFWGVYFHVGDAERREVIRSLHVLDGSEVIRSLPVPERSEVIGSVPVPEGDSCSYDEDL